MELQIMANNIASQVGSKMEKLGDIVLAIASLSALATTVDGDNATDFSNLTFFLSNQLSSQFEDIYEDLRKRVLPLVADITVVARVS
jgi:hypothetical protein